jgi:hypothetical protein
VDDVLGQGGHGACSAVSDGFFLVHVTAWNAVAAFDLVLPFIVFPDRVNEAVGHVRSLSG